MSKDTLRKMVMDAIEDSVRGIDVEALQARSVDVMRTGSSELLLSVKLSNHARRWFTVNLREPVQS